MSGFAVDEVVTGNGRGLRPAKVEAMLAQRIDADAARQAA
jgi:hypothetical protein